MNLNYTIDLGNIWDILSSIGTIVAVFLSLYLIWDEKRQKISTVSFTHDGTKEVQKSNSISIVSTRDLEFSAINHGKNPVSVLYAGMRVKKRGKKNKIIKIGSGEGITSNYKFIVLNIGIETHQYIVSFDDMEANLSEQLSPDKESFILQIIFHDVNKKEIVSELWFDNPKYRQEN